MTNSRTWWQAVGGRLQCLVRPSLGERGCLLIRSSNHKEWIARLMPHKYSPRVLQPQRVRGEMPLHRRGHRPQHPTAARRRLPLAPRVEVESEALRRDEALRQRGQLPRDVQELRFRPVRTNELDTDGESILRRAERYDQHWMTARAEWRNVRLAVVVVRPRFAIKLERAALLASLERGTKRDR